MAITEQDTLIQFPRGNASEVSLGDSGVQAYEVINMMTVITFATLTGSATLNLNFSQGVRTGARLLLKVPATATETLSLGTGITGLNIEGVAGKTKTQEFVFDGVGFVPAGAAVQID